ncbi:MAG: dihydropteroate synthase [Firmicutes bacterium]|nr:dihydropteroate synthase [Bacillota bacterium]
MKMEDAVTDKKAPKRCGDDFNLTWLNCRGGSFAPRLRAEMNKVGVEGYAAELMTAKGEFFALRAERLAAPAANILKQEFLSKGGECAVHPQVILGGPAASAAVMLATKRQYQLICAGLKRQQFGLPLLAEEIEQGIRNIGRESWEIPLADGRTLNLSTATQIMGILNVTPDSFSDGGSYEDVEQAVCRARQMLSEGALIIDVGGESTRPGHIQISEDEEISRVVPVIRALKAETDAVISVDTYKPTVARAALAAGADIINDIWGLQAPTDEQHEMAQLAAEFGCPVIVMHNRSEAVYGGRAAGWGENIPENIRTDVMSDVAHFFRTSRKIARAAGMNDEQLIFDIGFGFGKTPEQNMEILAQTAALRILGRPLLVATSRKSTLGLLTGRAVDERIYATAATTAAAAMQGAALVRVHDLPEALDVIRVCRPIYLNR